MASFTLLSKHLVITKTEYKFIFAHMSSSFVYRLKSRFLSETAAEFHLKSNLNYNSLKAKNVRFVVATVDEINVETLPDFALKRHLGKSLSTGEIFMTSIV